MRGKPIEDTRNVLSEALSKLDPEDSFSIIAFSGEIFLFSTSMEVATKAAIERATEWMSTNFIAGGGTNILLPLNKVSSPLFNWDSPYFSVPLGCTHKYFLFLLVAHASTLLY